MKKVFALVLALVLCLSLFAGCSKPAGTDTPAAGGTEITVVTSYGGDDGNRQNYEKAVADYEAATGNKVLDASATSNEEWKAKVMTDFETGTEPDVLFYFTGVDANPFVEAGKVVPLDEIRAAYPDFASNMKDELLVASPADSKIYTVPVNGFWESMFINKTVLEAAGVAIPGADYTYEQFLTDCEAIKAAGFTPIGASLNEVPHYWFEYMVFNHNTLNTQLTMPTSATDPAAESWIAGMNDIKDLYEKGFFPTNTLTMTDAEAVQMVFDGDAAFLIDGSWKVGAFVENNPDNLGDFDVVFVPGTESRPATELIGGISMGYYITRKAWDDPAKREAAVAFVSHMTNDTNVSEFSAVAVTALKAGAKPSGLNEFQVCATEMCAKASGLTGGAVQDLMKQEARNDLFASIPLIVTGQMTPEAALDQALALN